MGVFEAVALGITQGLTEFLPISSDGHLALVYRAIGKRPSLTFEVFLHVATLIATLVYFRRDIAQLLSSLSPKNRDRIDDRRTVALIALGTIVSGAVALVIGPYVEPMAASMTWVGIWFLATASFMVVGEIMSPRVPRVALPANLPWWKAGLIGLAQGAAVLPGLSRSGSTISSGMMAGLDRQRAARFSFLLGIPTISLAAANDALDIATGAGGMPAPVPAVAGFVAAGITGYLAIWGLLGFVKGHRLYWFAAYTGMLGTAILVWTLV